MSLQERLDGLVSAALEREQYLSQCIKRDAQAIKELNQVYLDIYMLRSGGRKRTPKKVALKIGEAYVRFTIASG